MFTVTYRLKGNCNVKKSVFVWGNVVNVAFSANYEDAELNLNTNQKDLDLAIGDDQKIRLPFGRYSLTVLAPKHKKKKIRFDIDQNRDRFIDINLMKKK